MEYIKDVLTSIPKSDLLCVKMAVIHSRTMIFGSTVSILEAIGHTVVK